MCLLTRKINSSLCDAGKTTFSSTQYFYLNMLPVITQIIFFNAFVISSKQTIAIITINFIFICPACDS